MSQPVIINTSRVVFLPSEVLVADTAEWYLSEAGVRLETDDAIILSPVIDGVGAVMVEKQQVIERLIEGVQSPVFISPAQQLLQMLGGLKKHNESLSFVISIDTQTVYVAAVDAVGKLFLIEAYPYDTANDVVFIADVLLRDEYDWHLYYCGNPSKECRKLLHKRFSKSEITEL